MKQASLSFRHAFTLVEIMIVVAIIGILAQLALPAYRRIAQHANGSVLMNDFRVFSGALEQYAQANGTFPSSFTAAGGIPAALAGMITPNQWTRPTPIGGNYAFLADQTVGGQTYKALVEVSGALTFTQAQLQWLDQKFDDGNLATGRLFTNGAGLSTYYVVEFGSAGAAGTPDDTGAATPASDGTTPSAPGNSGNNGNNGNGNNGNGNNGANANGNNGNAFGNSGNGNGQGNNGNGNGNGGSNGG